MRKEDKINLENKQITLQLITACLSTCEDVISRNAYLEKKWSNYYVFDDIPSNGCYCDDKNKWMDYRKKIRGLIRDKYSVNEITDMTKNETVKATQKSVKEFIELIDNNDYELVV